MDFEWDEAKAETNLRKHGVTFLEASEVFRDPLSDTFDDPDHSDREDRFLIIGATGAGRLLFVAFTERDETLRIISAREATRQERYEYENQS